MALSGFFFYADTAMTGKVLTKITAITVLLITILLIPQFYPVVAMIYFRLALIFWIIFETLRLFKLLLIDRNSPRYLTNSGIMILSLFIVFLILESVFMFIPRSHGVHYSLAAKLWLAKYWKPVNAYGYRDKEPQNAENVILFVGDSFTAGHGLKSIEQRFSNIVERELLKKGEKCFAVNIGAMDADTVLEYQRMIYFDYQTRIKPKVVVLQYYGNDIEGVAMKNGMTFGGFHPPAHMNKLLLFIGSGSYFINYLYWLYPKDFLGIPYLNFLKQAYKNKIILEKHKQDLMKFILYTRKNSIRLIVVAFPLLQDLELSDEMYLREIIEFFEENHITTINVASLVKDIPLKRRVININDAHASCEVHEIVAQEILKTLNVKN